MDDTRNCPKDGSDRKSRGKPISSGKKVFKKAISVSGYGNYLEKEGVWDERFRRNVK